MKILILNGPPDSGKDVAVELLSKKRIVIPFSFKRTLKAITLAVYDVPEKVWDGWYTRTGKELPRPELDGLSCRQALIKVSEEVIKPNYGKDFFGRKEAANIERVFQQSGISIAASSDGGFNEEIVPLVQLFGAENVFVLQIHRPDRTFAGDSRNWINIDSVPEQNYIVLHNDTTLEDFHTNVLDVYDYIANQK